MSKTTFIYVLIDPRNETRHYIGKTVQNPPQKRLRQHILKAASDDLAEWIDELKAEGLKPDFQVLEEVPPDADWRASEVYWIRHGLEHNWCLKNIAGGGDNYPIERLTNLEENAVISRMIFADEDTLQLLTSINAYVMRHKRAEDNTFRDLFHEALLLVNARDTDDFHPMKQTLCDLVLSHGYIQMGRGWRVPVIKKKNLVGGEFLAVGKPFAINGIAIPGRWDSGGWRTSIKVYKKTSELLDSLATEMIDDRRRGYNTVLQAALDVLSSVFDQIVAM